MAKTRERQCTSYICEGVCARGREGTFNKQCQKCDRYVPKPGAAPRRTDNRKAKREKIQKKEMRNYG